MEGTDTDGPGPDIFVCGLMTNYSYSYLAVSRVHWEKDTFV